MKLKSLLLSSVVALGLCAGQAHAEKFRAATWNPAGSANDKFLTDFANLARDASKGAIDFEVFPGGVLMPAQGTLEGMQKGVADIANITAAYIPSKMPVDFVTANLSFVADDQMALAFAKTEVTFFNPQMQEELKKLHVVFATGFTIGIYNLICGFEAHDLADFQGKKVRTSSDAQAGFINEIGGVPVNAPASEIYTGMQRGTIDCTAGSPLFLTDFAKLAEVAKSDYLIPLGSNANGGYYFNQDFWKNRTPDERKLLLHALSESTAREMIEWGGNIDKAWQAAKDHNVELVKPTDADLATLAAYKKEFISNLAKESMEKSGIDDPTDLINQMTAAMDKWKKLLDGVDRSNVEQVSNLLNKEIFDKIDVNTYGLN